MRNLPLELINSEIKRIESDLRDYKFKVKSLKEEYEPKINFDQKNIEYLEIKLKQMLEAKEKLK